MKGKVEFRKNVGKKEESFQAMHMKAKSDNEFNLADFNLSMHFRIATSSRIKDTCMKERLKKTFAKTDIRCAMQTKR